jgi:hypothetical protein
MNVLLIIKAKILVFAKWSYRFSQACRLLSFQWLSYFGQVVQSLLNTYVFWYPFLESP